MFFFFFYSSSSLQNCGFLNMAKLVSSWSKDIKSVPNDYILPPEQRPQLDIPFCDEFPVIDLSLTDRVYLATQIIKALEEFTAFQVFILYLVF